MTVYLREHGYLVNRKRVIKLMHKLGLQTIYQKKRTSASNPEHRVYPYLIRDLETTEPIKCGVQTLHICQLAKDIIIWLLSWTGIADGFYRGVSVTQWMLIFVVMLWRKRYKSMANLKSLIVTKEANLHLKTSLKFCLRSKNSMWDCH